MSQILRIGGTVAALCLTGLAQAAPAATFKRLKGAEIRSSLSGKEFTDEIHWTERYRADGTIRGASMGRNTEKRWLVRANSLCITDEGGQVCYEVWRSGQSLEMRLPGGDDFPRTGIIRP